MRFNLRKADEEKVNTLIEAGCTSYQAELLAKRGLDTPEKVKHYLEFGPKDLRDVNTMKDAEEFLSVLEKAIKEGKAITICGDYDADGIMATTIFMKGIDSYIEATGSSSRKVQWFINDRFKEGYGLNEKSIEHLLEKCPDTQLIITCDNGIKSAAAIRMALDRGVDVIVSDHHGQSEDEPLPDCPVVCEKRLDEDPNGEWFCGAELARRLVTELYKRACITLQHKDLLNSLLAYSGFATITDSVPMNAANHYIAKMGLYAMYKFPDPIWRCMAGVTKISTLDEEVIGFRYGPMINAASRVTGSVEKVMKAMEASMAGDTNACMEAVMELSDVNIQRREMTAEDERIALEIAESTGMATSRCIVVENEHFEPGINGLTASRLVETYHVPVIVLCPSDDPDVYKGSARSIEGFNIFEALGKCSDLLVGFGGHPMAAGVSCRKENIPEFRKRMNILANKAGVTKTDDRDVDFIFKPEEVNEEFINDMKKLAPFGPGFEKPAVGLQGVVTARMVLRDTHLRYELKADVSDTESIRVLWWNAAERESTKLPDPLGREVCVSGFPSTNIFDGMKTVQFTADDVQFAS